MDAILNYKPDPSEDFYGMLGCYELSTTEQIAAEYKARVLSCHPDKHPSDQQAAERFQLLQRAKDVLTDPQKRAGYDNWRKCGISVSFADWCSLKDTVKTSMHWATKKCDGNAMIEGSTYQDEKPSTRHWVAWESDQASDMLRKFRNYEL